MKKTMSKLLKKFQSKPAAALLSLALVIVTIVCTVALFSDRATTQMTFTTATFTKDGYTLTTAHPDGPFIANEDVVVNITEKNTKDNALDSTITMTVSWTSPDPDCNIFGNADAADNATITVDGKAISADKITVSDDNKSITFDLPKHTLAAGGKEQYDLIFHIPDSLMGTGSLSFTYDKVFLKQSPSGFSEEILSAELNAEQEHNFTVKVGWAASAITTDNGKSIMGYLKDDEADGEYEIYFELPFDKVKESPMKDFTADKLPKWHHYKDSTTKLTLVEGMTTIGDYTFSGFEGITELTLPESTTAVGAWAFDNITIPTLTVPEKVAVFEEMSFGHINELKEITFNQKAGTTVTFPEPGADTGAFYVDPYVETEIITEQDEIQYGYTWAHDQRRPIPMLDFSNYWQLRYYDEEAGIYEYDIDYDLLTSINIVDYYKPDGTEITWDASADDVPGTVTAYLTQDLSELTLAGNGYGSILANPDSSYAFSWFSEVTEINGGEYLNMSKAVNCEGTFSMCMSLTSLDTSNWDMSNVKYMGGNEYASYGMFMRCESLAYIDVDEWDVGNVENMNRLFENCEVLNNLDVSGWDTKSLVYGENVFYRCESMTSLDVKDWKMGSVITTNGMFSYCEGLSTLDVSRWNVSNVEDMTYMFADCSNLGSLNLAGWDVSSAVTMAQMFNGCTLLTTIGATDDWNTESLEEMSYMFASCSSLPSVSVKNWDTSKVTSLMGVFMNCTVLNSVDVSLWDVSSATNMQYMFRDCVALESVDVSNWTPTSLAFAEQMFSGCTVIDGIDVSGWNTPELYYVRYMFQNCAALTSIDISNWDLSSVSSAYDPRGMFIGCTSLKSLTIPASLPYLGIQFAANCPELKTIIFLHDTEDSLNYQMAGSSTGAFYVDSHVETYIVTESNHTQVKNYDWSTDNRGALYCNFGINLMSPPDKTEYAAGEDFDKTGMQFVVIFDDGTVKDVTDLVTIVDGKDLKVGQTKVGITYAEGGKTFSADVPITVKKQLSGIAVTTPPTKTQYLSGDNFDPTGLELIVTYEDGSTKTITGGFTVGTDGKNLTVGQNSVTVSYEENGKTVSTKVTVTVLNPNPTLAAGDTWYSQGGTTIEKASITEIEFKDSYTPASTPTASWDASAAKDGSVMAYVEGTKLTLAGNGTNKVYANTDSFEAFARFTAVTAINGLGILDTTNVTSMKWMFYGCSKLTDLDVSNFNTENVGTMNGMFYNCSSLTNLDVSDFNTENVGDMNMMFAGCSKLTDLDVSNFKTENVTNMGSMFNGCSSLTVLDVTNFNTERVTDMNWMFRRCSSLKGLDVSNFSTALVTNMGSMFDGCSGLTVLDISNFNTERVTNMNAMFAYCSRLTNLDVSNFNTERVWHMGSMFNGCSSLTVLDVSNFNTANVTAMDTMFSGCKSLTVLDVSDFNTSKVTTMRGMFASCDNLTSLDVSNFDTRSITSAKGLCNFAMRCINLTTITLGENFGQEVNAGAVRPGEEVDSDSGMFYIGAFMETTVNGANSVMQAYDWATDNRMIPTLAEGDTWYTTGTTTAKSSIKTINIVNAYIPDGDETESWNASVDKDGDGNLNSGIKCYIEGTTLTIVGNGSGAIRVSTDLTTLFNGFTNVTKTTGLDILDVSNATLSFNVQNGALSGYSITK